MQIVKVSTDVSAVAFEGMVRKTAQGKHLPESDQIIVHNGTSFVMKCQSEKTGQCQRRRTDKRFKYVVVGFKNLC